MYKSLPLVSFPVFPFINMHNWETASYILFSAKNSYINKTNTHIHKVEVKSLYFNFVWLTEPRFLLSISRKWKTIEVSDHTFYGFTGVITYFGCWENTRKACKSLAFGSWFTSFSRVLPTFRVGYHAGKPIESVVYILNKLWSFNDSIFPYLSLPRFSIRACMGSCPCSSTVVPTLTHRQTSKHIRLWMTTAWLLEWCWQVPKQTDGVRTPTDTTVQRITVTGLTHNIVTSLPMSFCGSDEDCSMGGAVDALSSVDVACTQTLFYFSFRSFQKHRRARERVNKYPCSRDFEEKIEGLWVG